MKSSTLDQIRDLMVGLKMARALEALEDIVRQVEQGGISTLDAIHSLLAEEHSTRESWRIKMALTTARLTRGRCGRFGTLEEIIHRFVCRPHEGRTALHQTW